MCLHPLIPKIWRRGNSLFRNYENGLMLDELPDNPDDEAEQAEARMVPFAVMAPFSGSMLEKKEDSQ